MYISSPHDDPTDDQVEQKCTDIVVNDITIPVDTSYGSNSDNIPLNDNNTNDNNKISEEKYDNIDLLTNQNNQNQEDNDSKMKKLLTNMEKKNNKLEDINVIKDNNIKQKTDDIVESKHNIPDYSFTNLYSSMNNPIKESNTESMIFPIPEPEPEPEPTPVPEPEPAPVPEPEPPVSKDTEIKLEKIDETKQSSPVENKPNSPNSPNSPKKEIVTIENENDIDETSTLVNFFNDMKQIVEDKGIKVETNQNNNFTLFEDASVVEN